MFYDSMHPMNIYNYNYNNNYPTFKSVNRLVSTKQGRVYQTFTQFFRSDLNWENTIEFLETKYKNCPNVNIFNLACSEGAEPISLSIILNEKLKDDAKKFNIIASDIDEKNIQIAQNGTFDITNKELYRINKKTNNKFDKYFMPVTSSTGEISKLILKPELKNRIEYKISDILTEIKNAPKSNSVFLIRNVWPYLNEDEKCETLRELAKLDKSSCVIIGEIDHAININQALELYGFKKTPIMHLFEKEY